MTKLEAYRDICRGYSEINWNGPLFIKHPTPLEHFSLMEHYSVLLEKARSLEIISEAQATEDLIREDKWTRLKENSMNAVEEKIAGLEDQKKTISHESQIDGIYDAIQEYKDYKLALMKEKNLLLPTTAEQYAGKLLREYFIENTCFRDKKFEKPIESIEYSDVDDLIINYSNSDISPDLFKEICIQTFFWPLFTLSEDPSRFFDKPLTGLSYNQVYLLRCAGTYAKVASETSDVPDRYATIPEKLFMWYMLKRNNGKTFETDKSEEDEVQAKIRMAFGR